MIIAEQLMHATCLFMRVANDSERYVTKKLHNLKNKAQKLKNETKNINKKSQNLQKEIQKLKDKALIIKMRRIISKGGFFSLFLFPC